MTYAEYLALERSADVKHEYVNGRVFAMAGGTPEHARLAGAVIGDLRTALRGKPCVPFSSDLRVRVAATGRATYPDVTVVCGALVPDPNDADAVQNPTVLVEVLSDTTESDDRGDKWAHYQRIPALREYVLVSQKHRHVEVYSRDAAGDWRFHEWSEGQRCELPALGIALDVDAIYVDPTA